MPVKANMIDTWTTNYRNHWTGLVTGNNRREVERQRCRLVDCSRAVGRVTGAAPVGQGSLTPPPPHHNHRQLNTHTYTYLRSCVIPVVRTSRGVLQERSLSHLPLDLRPRSLRESPILARPQIGVYLFIFPLHIRKETKLTNYCNLLGEVT